MSSKFYTQRLTNRFPRWTKVRRDPSSMGHRLLSVFADYLAYNNEFNLNSQDASNLLRRDLGLPNIYSISLEEADFFTITRSVSGVKVINYPTTVQGTVSATPYTLTRYDSITDLMVAAPDRFTSKGTQTFSSYSVWSSSAPYTYTAIPEPERLIVKVSGSTEYIQRKLNKNVNYYGRTGVLIKGTDQNDIEFIEHVAIPDDGLYMTRNIFKTVTEVTHEGFDGSVDITWADAGISYLYDMYNIGITQEFEGRLKLELSTEVIDATTQSILTYKAVRYDRGTQYRNGSANLIPDFEEVLVEQVLLDDQGNPYTAVDFCLNPRTNHLLVLSSTGIVHVYEHGPTLFTAADFTDTSTGSDIQLDPLNHYVKLGQTEKLFTFFARIRKLVGGVVIKRTNPSGVERYLNGSMAWQVSSFSHENTFDNKLPEEAWRNLQFETEYDELGVWKYEVTSIFDDETHVFETAVMVDSMNALSSIDTGLGASSTLYIDRKGQICVQASTTITKFEENINGYIADPSNQRILVRDSYDSITVTV
jgi:hypothetical protein